MSTVKYCYTRKFISNCFTRQVLSAAFFGQIKQILRGNSCSIIGPGKQNLLWQLLELIVLWKSIKHFYSWNRLNCCQPLDVVYINPAVTISLTGKSWYLYTDLCSTYYTCLTETGLTAFWEKKLSDFKWTVRKITMNINLYSHPLNHIVIITSWAMHISINMIVINLCFNNNCSKVKFLTSNFWIYSTLIQFGASLWQSYIHVVCILEHSWYMVRSNWIKQFAL